MSFLKQFSTIIIISSLFLLIGTTNAFSDTAVLSWDPPTQNSDGTPLTDLSGYKLYYGNEVGNYTNSIDIGNVTTYTVENLEGGSTYYFALTAYDTSGNESKYSAEASKTIPLADITSPVLSNITASSITESSAIITWTSDEASDSRVEYGSSSSYGNISTLDSSMVKSHSIQISGLEPSTHYHYRVLSRDASGNEGASGDYTFMSAAGAAATTVQYYCDKDGDGYANASSDGTCQGYGCEPSGCLTDPGTDCNDWHDNINPGMDDAGCDGIDNNCDGTPDNNYITAETSCGTGACAATGELICSDGSIIDTCTAGQPTGDDSDCDGIDDNCDGTPDNNYVTTETACGAGACAATGELTCSNGSVVDTCTAGAPTGDDSDCDGIDDNCDGTPDNNYVISAISCGTGVCSSSGQLLCENGSEINTCEPYTPSETAESSCDDLDNDCDGSIDEGCQPSVSVSRVLMREDFASGTPESWTATGAWNTSDSCGLNPGYPFVTPYEIVDSACSATGVDELISAPLRTESCSEVKLSFSDQHNLYTGLAQVDVTADGMEGWTEVLRLGADSSAETPDWTILDISDVAGAGNAQVRFAYVNDGHSGYWAVDNVWVTCRSTSLDFSSSVNQQSAPQEILLTNAGAVDLSIGALLIEGADAADFKIVESDGCSEQLLAPSESCTAGIVFTPSSAGTKSAVLHIFSDDPDSPEKEMYLTGLVEEGDLVNPMPLIRANGSGDSIILSRGTPLQVTIELDPGSYSGTDTEQWLLMQKRNSMYYYNPDLGLWRHADELYKQGPLYKIDPVVVLDETWMSRGSYVFYYIIDMNVDGLLDTDPVYRDVVEVEVVK